MPAQWTGTLIGKIHNAGFRIKDVANEAKLNTRYVSQVLNSDSSSEKARKKLEDAFMRLVNGMSTNEEIVNASTSADVSICEHRGQAGGNNL